MKYQYHIFISYAYDNTLGYNKLVKLLEKNIPSKYINYSIPKPRGSNKIIQKRIQSLILDRVIKSNIVIVIADNDTARRPWIKFEVLTAKKFNKPILGIYQDDQKYHSDFIKETAAEIVAWDEDAIISTIQKLSVK